MISSRALLNTHESSVAKARFEMMPIHRLQMSLREVDHLMFHYAIERDQSAVVHFKEIEKEIDKQLRLLAKAETQFNSVAHAHSSFSLLKTTSAWREARTKVLKVFQHTPGTIEATNALSRAHAVINPVYEVVSKFHHLSMQGLQNRLGSAQSVAGSAFSVMLSMILVGLALLSFMGYIVGRSVTQPIAALQLAARKLAKKDFSHRIKLRNNTDELGQLGRAFNTASCVLQRLYRDLERRSTYDGLTGVLNRANLDERLSDECKSADRHKRSLALLMVDIDFFKQINDSHGHQAGDRILRTVAQLLNEATRPGDVVTRYGGDEFAIILPETDEDRAVAMAERLRITIENAYINCTISENISITISITISIGCAIRRQHTLTPKDLVKASDTALYRAKETGRNRVVSARKLSPVTNVPQQTVMTSV